MTDERIQDIWGSRTPYRSGDRWPARVDEYLAGGLADAEVERWVRGACVLCGRGDFRRGHQRIASRLLERMNLVYE